jgi:serine/threonine protein kinase
MSPEQVRGDDVDARADIFSVGAVSYELLSHQQAFPGKAPEEVFQRILDGAPTPITEYCPDIDPRLVRLIERALEKDPDRRFQEVTARQKELANIRISPLGAESRLPVSRNVASAKLAATSLQRRQIRAGPADRGTSGRRQARI